MDADRILALLPLQAAQRVCCYVALPDEVETRPLIEALWAAGKHVSVPKIVGPGEMVAVPIQRWADLALGTFGVLEPKAAYVIERDLDVVVVPGQAFTLRGERKGRGHGYYDRFLAAHPAAVRVALATESQIVDRLPTRSHDEPVDWIVTERRILETTSRSRGGE